MKTSSPSDRKTFLPSPGLLANPKNFRLMGGGGGGCGGPFSAAISSGVFTGALGCGISALGMHTFCPLPSYLVSSLAFSKSYRRLGSSERAAVLAFLPWPLPVRPVPAAREVAVGESVGIGGVGAAAFGPEPPELNRSTITAIAISATAAISLVRFSAPTFTSHLFSLRRYPSSDKFPVSVAV